MSLQNQQQMHLFLMELLGKYTTFFFFFFSHTSKMKANTRNERAERL